MLYGLLRPFLFRLAPERAHDAALRASTWLARHKSLAVFVRARLARPAVRPVHLLGLEFPHAIGLAAGFDKNAVAPLAWWALGFGFVELGTVTPRPQAGSPRPRMFRLAAQHALVNRMAFNNNGAAAVATRLVGQAAAGLRPPFPIGISVGKNADTPLDRAAEDYAAAARTLNPHADFIAMNISSPNTPGLRDLQERATVHRLVTAAREAVGAKPVLVKLAPELQHDALRATLDAALEAGAAGFIATNTLATAGRDDLPAGGLSGRPLREMALRCVAEIRRHVGPRVALIGCGGIDDLTSVQAMLDAGADLLQLYTGMIYEGPFLAARLSRRLASLAPRQ